METSLVTCFGLPEVDSACFCSFCWCVLKKEITVVVNSSVPTGFVWILGPTAHLLGRLVCHHVRYSRDAECWKASWDCVSFF